MATDIRIGKNEVEIESGHVKIVGHDLHLKSDARVADRRKSRTTRRALVHGFKDELILNYDQDYEHTHIVGKTQLDRLEVGDDKASVRLDSGARVTIKGADNASLVLISEKKARILLLGGSAYFDGDLVQVESGTANNEWGAPKGGFEIVKELKKLMGEVTALKLRVLELEKKR